VRIKETEQHALLVSFPSQLPFAFQRIVWYAVATAATAYSCSGTTALCKLQRAVDKQICAHQRAWNPMVCAVPQNSA
jgi:hypothetical protein